MKILYHHRTLGDGAEGIHIREMVKAFRALGNEVRVIGPVGEIAPQAVSKPHGLSRIKKALPPVLFELMEIGYSAYSFVKTTLEIWRYRPSFIYDRYITFNAGIVCAGKAHGVPVFLEVNAPLALERSQQEDEVLWLKAIARRMERWICRNASRVIVVSTPLKDYLESLGVQPERCVVMPNGVDPERFRPRPKNEALADELGIPAGSFVIGFTGVLRRWHGLDLLMKAFAPLVERRLKVFLLIVGDGNYRPVIERMAAESGLQNSVRITGRVAHDRVPEYVGLFDVAVSSKATFYASPMKVTEYMALAKAVLVPNTQNFLDMVDANVNGCTFQNDDAGALSEALTSLYNAPEDCASLGLAAREKVERRLNWKWNAIACCNLVEEVGRSR